VEVTRVGLGCAPLGNMFRALDDAEATATVLAAWDDGVRLFDTAPLYGHGLSERRLGAALRGLHALKFSGCHLTIPHKQEAMAIVDDVDETARRIGAKAGAMNMAPGSATKSASSTSRERSRTRGTPLTLTAAATAMPSRASVSSKSTTSGDRAPNRIM